MLKNILKRTLSSLLVLMLIATTFFIFDPSVLFTTAEAAVSKTDPTYTNDLMFVVPEVIYLTPVYNGYSTSTTSSFKFYANDTSAGAVDTDREETSGYIYFKHSGTSSVKISFKWQSAPGTDLSSTSTISFGDGAKAPNTGSYTLNLSSGAGSTSVSGGTSPSLAKDTTGCYVCWIATYTDPADNVSKQAYAYSYVYKPYAYPIGVAVRAKNTRGTNHWATSTSWISGVHGCGSGGDSGKRPKTGGSGYLPIAYGGADTGNSVVLYMSDRFKTNYGNDAVSSIYTDSSNSDCPNDTIRTYEGTTSQYSSGDATTMTFEYSAYGKLSVDTSRYSNLNQVPNLTVGLMVLSDESSSSGAGFFIANRTDHSVAYTSNKSDYYRNGSGTYQGYWNTYYNDDKLVYQGNFDNFPSTPLGEGEGVKYHIRWRRDISSESDGTDRIFVLGAGYANHQGADRGIDLMELRCEISILNKSELRSAYYYAMKTFPANNLALLSDTSNSWKQFIALYRAVAKWLTKVDCGGYTTTSVNSTNYTTAATLAQALKDKADAIKVLTNSDRATYTATQKNIKVYDSSGWKYHGSYGDKTASGYHKGATVSYTAETVPGYTYKGYRTSAESTTTDGAATAGTASNITSGNYSHKATGAETVTYYYLRDTYTITYNSDGGGAVSNTSYNIDSSTTKLPSTTKSGYTFAGWKPTSNVGSWSTGTTYAANTTLDGKYGNVTLKAQWTANPYQVTFNVNHDSIPTNLFAFNANAGASSVNGGSSAGVTYSYDPATSIITINGTTTSGLTFSINNFTSEAGDYIAYAEKVGGTVAFTNSCMVLEPKKDGVNPSSGRKHMDFSFTGNTSTSAKKTFSAANEANEIRLWCWCNTDKSDRKIVFTNTQYKIAFYKASSTPSSYVPSGRIATYASAYGTLPTVSRTGYTFNGWKNGSTSITSSTTVSTASAHTLTADWTINKSTLTVKPNGGTYSGSSNNTSYSNKDYNSTQSIADPSRTGYNFSGWTLGGDSNGSFNSSTKVYTFGPANGKTDTLTAGWNPISYSITYDLKSGSLASGVTNPSTYTIETTTFTLNNPERTGYTFAGWTGTGLSSASTTVTITKGSTGDRGYTATWTANPYTLTFNPNSGSFKATGGFSAGTSSQSKTVTYGSTYGASDSNSKTWPTVERTGYTFQNWTSNGASNGTVYASTGTVSITTNTEIKAYWTATSYSISYSGITGVTWGTNNSTTNPNKTSYTIETNTFTLTNPNNKTGYTFKGWSGTGLTGDTNTSVSVAKGSYGTRSYTANWTTVGYTITYNVSPSTLTGLKWGTNNATTNPNPNSYNIETTTFTLVNPSRTGYTFNGWGGTGLTGTANTPVSVAKGSYGNRTYTAYFTANPYTLTFNPNSGSFKAAGGFSAGTSSQSKTVTYDSTYGASDSNSKTWPTVERVGYDFKKWTSDGTNSGTTYTSGGTVSITANTEIKAYWELHSYSISYTMNSGSFASGDVHPTSYTIATSAFTLSQPTRTGYDFKGWTGSNGTTKQLSVTVTPGTTNTSGVTNVYADLTFTANWDAHSYNISYTMNSGSFASGDVHPTTYKVTDAAFTLSQPTKTGYTFNGWTGSNGSTAQLTVKVTPGTGTTSGLTNVHADLTFTANFTVQSYTLTFKPNGGTFKAENGFSSGTTEQTKQITYGQTYGKADGSKTWPTIERTGYTFGGWKNTVNGTTTTYTSTTTVSVTAGHDVTAQWSIINYTITCNVPNDATWPDGTNPATYTVNSAAIAIKKPARVGYTFEGWTGTGLSGATKNVTIAAGSHENKEYTATWKTVSYTITYNVNPSTLTGLEWGADASDTNPNKKNYTVETAAFTLTNPSRSGYTFQGWSGGGLSGDTNQSVTVTPGGGTTSGTTNVHAALTFTANFTANTYAVTFDKQSGTGGTNSVTATYGSAMPTAEMPTRTGYTFQGYYTETDGSGTQYYTAAGASARNWAIADARTLYAYWTINKSTLTVKPNGGTYSGSTNDTSYSNKSYGSTQSVEDATRTGYTFTGWTKGGNGNGTWNASTKTFTFGSLAGKTDTLTAKWSINTSTLIVKPNGGTYNGTTSDTTYADKDYNSTQTVADAERTGYTFGGWTKGGDGNGTWDATHKEFKFGSLKGKTDTLTAQWTANTYTLTFNPNGGYFDKDSNNNTGGFTTGTGQTGTQEKTVTYNSTYGAKYNTTENKTWPTVKRTGYTFQNWTSDGTNNGTVYASTDTVSITTNTEIKAYWTATKYTISYSGVSGVTWGTNNSATNPNKTEYYITTANFTLTNPNKTGYTFKGWSGTGLTGDENATVTIAKGSTGNKAYTANWTAINYTITYELHDGIIPNNQSNPASYTIATDTITLKNPVKTGYDFAGWTGSGTGMTVTIPKGSTGNKSYEATYTPIDYAVTLDMEGGENGTESVTATYNADMPSIADGLPSKNGYTFQGYYSGQNAGGTKYYNADGTSARTWNIASATTLYAYWTETTFTITFNVDDGENVNPQNKMTYKISSTSRLPSTTRTGYNFGGWMAQSKVGSWTKYTSGTTGLYAGGNGTTTGFSLNGMYGSVTLKAKWEAVQYTITYKPNGGDTTPAAQTYYITGAIALASDPGRTGYTFDGWMPESASGNWSASTVYAGSVESMYGNVTLKAQWTPITYTLTFMLNGGSLTAGGGFAANTDAQTKGVTYDSTYGADYYEEGSSVAKSWPNVPTKTGYSFGGWKNGSTTFESGGKVTITDDTTVTATWNIMSYNVTVQTVNSGTATSGFGTASVKSVTAGTASKPNYNATVTLQQTASTGYRFTGWTSSDVTIANNKFTMPAKAVTVTANFEPITYTISYTLNSGALTGGKTNPTSYTIETPSFTLNNPDRTGYTFDGWTGSNSATTPSTTVTIAGSTGNKEYVANWTGNTYSVTLNREGGTTGATGVRAKYGSAMPTATMPTKDGYTFKGYFAQANGQGTKYYNEDGTSAHNWDVADNAEIHAYWTIKTYTIGYTLAGGSLASGVTNPETYTIESEDITLNNPTRTGYTFAGWTGTGLENATQTVVIETGSFGNRTYTATWNLITYTITYDLAGGALASGQSNPDTYTIESEEITLKNPSKGGYNFTGWKGIEGTTPTTPTTSLKIPTGSTGNRKYQATYQARSWTLSFESDGDETVPQLSYKPTDTTLLGSTTKTGYAFTGWKVTTAAGSWQLNATFGAGTSVKDKWGNATLTAQWEIRSFTLTVDPAGGTFNNTTDPSNFTQNYNTPRTIGAASRDGYTFNGWVKYSGAGTYTPNEDATTGGTFTYGAGPATIKAQWTAITYTISYNYGVGENSVTNPTSYTIETPSFTLNNPSKAGYTFDGWTGTNLSGTTPTVTITKGSTGNKGFKAEWSAKTYTVTLNRQGGTTGAQSVSVTFAAAMPSAAMPTRTGYTFKGYYDDTNGAGTKYYEASGSSARAWDKASNATLYAYWTANVYTLTFNPNGGHFDVEGDATGGFTTGESYTDPQDKQVTYGGKYGDADAAGKTWPAKVTYTGHTFDGWKNGDTTFVATGDVTITGNTILTAQWIAKTFTLAFDMNGVSATVSPATKTLSYGLSSTYADTPTRTDTHNAWEFVGWSTNPNATSGATGTISAQTVNTWFGEDGIGEDGTKTVYAIWSKTLTAKFKDGQGADMTSNVTIYNGAASGQVTVQAQRDYSGWTKMGWATGTSNTATGDKTSTKFTIQSSSITDTATSVMYYGRYDRTVAVTYNANGGKTTPQPTSVTQQTNANNLSSWTNPSVDLAAAIERDGYTFAGWKIGSTTYTGGASYTITGNVTAVAQWNLSNFTVTIVPNNGSVSNVSYYSTGTTAADVVNTGAITASTSLSMVCSTTTTIELPVRNGYAFSGWTVTATGGGALPADGVMTNSTNGASTYKVGAGNVTLTATWTPRNYILMYASGKDDVAAADNSYAYNADVTIRDETALGVPYPGYSFAGWFVSVSEDGDMYFPGETFNLSSYDIDFSELEQDEQGNPIVYMTAEWTVRNYKVVYDRNGYALNAIQKGGRKALSWLDEAGGEYLLYKGGETSVPIRSAYVGSTATNRSYFYLNTGSEIRFGLGWTYTAGGTEVDVEFGDTLKIDNVPDDVLLHAELPDEGEDAFKIRLYMVWSADYSGFEEAVAMFQREYMTFAASGNTLRGMTYTDASKAVYTNAPLSARLPAVDDADAAYRAYGAEANAIWNNNTSAADYATYAWVAGPIGNGNAWSQLHTNDANAFTADSLNAGSNSGFNHKFRDLLSNVIYEPCSQFAQGKIMTQAQEEAGELHDLEDLLIDAIEDRSHSELLAGLKLKDADLDYKLTNAEMAAFDTESITYSDACENEEYEGGLSYRPDETTAGFLSEVFGECPETMYPNCETEELEDGTVVHHSFNSLLEMANEIFSTFGFDPEAARNNTNYFQNGSVMGFDLDDDGYVINPDCPYTTQSVQKLFDVIYGSLSEGAYKTKLTGNINVGEVALYYQVKEIHAGGDVVKLRNPSQNKLNQIVTIMAYAYHQLKLDEADYTEMLDLFQRYFDATWGVRLSQAGYSLGSNYLSSYADFFTEESYNALSRFMSEYFEQAGTLKSTLVKRPGIEQKMIDGRTDNEDYIRTYKNAYVNARNGDTVDLSAFNFAERAIRDEDGNITGYEGTLCSEYCDLIDALVPATGDYTAVFALIANNAQRTADAESYMIDTRTYGVNNFYPSTAGQVTIGSNYDTWYTEYAKSNAWTSTRANGKPAYDTEWLYRYYTKASVDSLKDTISSIVWNYNKLDQAKIDGATNGTFNNGTICKTLKTAIDNLVPKEYRISFYKGLSADDSDWLNTITFYLVDGAEKPYRFGTTVAYTATPNPDLSLHKTFVGWNTMRNNLGHNVSSAANVYTTDLVLDEVLLEQWLNAGTAVVETSDNQTYTVKLYAEWVDNVTLDIVMNGGTVIVTAEDESTFTATDDGGNHPTYDYGKTLTFGAPEKTGYQFREWVFTAGANNTDSAFANGVYTFGYSGQPKTNDTLTATWTPNTYTVTFHANAENATGTMAAQEFRYDTAQALTANAFTRRGWKFKNWVTSTNVEYSDEQSVINLTATQNGNVDLYAVWEVADFTLTFKNEFTLPDWYDSSLATFTWASWAGSAATNADLTKTITANELYNKADANGKTWPSDPVITYEISNDYIVEITFLGWYTQKDEGGSKIEATGTVSATENVTLYPHFNFSFTKLEKDELKIVFEQVNANEYTIESLQYVDAWLVEILDEDHVLTQDDLNELARRRSLLVKVTDEDGAKEGDVTPPVVSMYENKAALQKAITDGTFQGDEEDIAYMLSDDVGETSFVFPGKSYYTYYCYTNSAQPAIMLSAKDVAGDSGRVSYPVTFSMRNNPEDENDMNGTMLRTRTGTVKGFLKYTDDAAEGAAETTRSAGYHIGTNEIANPYGSGTNALHYVGMNYEGTGYDHYSTQEYILLKPTFDTAQSGKQYALYTFEVRDDSVGDLATNKGVLAGAAGTTYADTNIASTNETVTPTNTVTVFVEYYNTMNGYDGDAGGQIVNANGEGTHHNNALEVYTKFHENGYQNNVWVKQDKLYRNSGGAATEDFIKPKQAQADGTYTGYIANDPIYGQTSVGSFYYLMKSTDKATTEYWNAYDRYLMENPEDDYQAARVAGANAALKTMEAKVRSELIEENKVSIANRAAMDGRAQQGAHVENGDYLYWPYSTSTQWSALFCAPARTREDTLVYVHIYDRYGNTYTNILQRDLQDTQPSEAAQIARGEVVINELGGGGIKNISITELNTQKKVTVAGMTSENGWDSSDNHITITGLPEGSNNYTYTMWITDNAENEMSINFQANSDGSVTITINDETMGGSYADAASQPLSADDPQNGVSVGANEEAPLTTLAIEEGQPDEIAAETIPEAQLNGAAAEEEEERPDVYTFMLNEVYVVNLFSDATRDYEVTLKSSAGGTLKAYVNGEFMAPKAGKVTIPGGSQVQIRVFSNSGYELESLSMIYPDGRTVSLAGAYNAEINDDVTIKATFVETSSLLTVRVVNGAVSGKQELHVSPYSRVAVVAEEAPEGKVFAYWAQNGEDDVPVSYDEIYTFVVTSDVELKAIYADAPTAQIASIAMDAASPTHVTVVNGRYTLSYSGKITVPEGAQIEEFGLVLTNQSADDCTAENFVIGGQINGVNVAKLAGQTMTEEGQCKINVNNVAAGQTRTGRLYLTVKLADGTTQTIYSNTWSELNTPAA